MAESQSIHAEVWKPVVGYEDFYEVSNQGRVRRTARYLAPAGNILSQWTLPRGHQQVVMSVRGKRCVDLVHRLVLNAFLGLCPKGMECRHLDGNPQNNSLSNLTWGTHLENMDDMVRHGHCCNGEKSHHAKLTDAEVLAIRDIKTYLGWSHNRVAKFFNVSKSTVSLISLRKTWTHI